MFDNGVKILDRNCADNTFRDAFLFFYMKPEFDIQLDGFCHKLQGWRLRPEELAPENHGRKHKVP